MKLFSKYKTYIILFLATFCVSTIATAKEKVRIGTHFKTLEFNSVASSYYEHPTFLELHISKKKPEQLWIWSDFIKKSENAKYFNGYDFLSLSVSAVDDYIAAVDKYLKWREIAKRDGDIIEKEISRAQARKKSLKVKFSFFSGNAESHYLYMQHCAVGTCLDPAFYFDYDNALLLKETLVKWKAGGLRGATKEEVDEKYK